MSGKRGRSEDGQAAINKRRRGSQEEEDVISEEVKDEDEMNQSQMPDFRPTMGNEAEIGIIEKISLKNFMCHNRLDVSLQPSVNFVIGHNGSGKSAIMTGLVVGLGGKAAATSRGTSVKSFIKDGKQVAEISIKLRNLGQDAFKPQEYGKSIIVERRLTVDGTSSYKLKSADGKIVSTKRDELNHILDQFNIQVDNPISLLNQDTSRNFLHSKSPHDKYKFFLKATQLEQMKHDYVSADLSKDVSKDILRKKMETMPVLEREVKEWEQKYKSLSNLEDLKNKVGELKNEMAWSLVALKEKEVEQAAKEVKVEEDRIPKFQLKVDQTKKEEQKYNTNFKNVEAQLTVLAEQVKDLEPHSKEAKAKMDGLKKVFKDRQNESRRAVHNCNTISKEKAEIEKRINEIKSSAQQDFEAERHARDLKIQELEEKEAQVTATVTTTSHDLKTFHENAAGCKRELMNIRQEEKDTNERAKNANIHATSLKGSRKNTHRKFGPWMPSVIEKIEAASNGRGRNAFHEKPRGPLGAYISLHNPEWALAVECAIGGLLNSFCVTDHYDEKMLEKIFQESQIPPGKKPAIITMKFRHQEYDTRHAKPRAEYNTVREVLKIDDPVVANCLIDQGNIETVVLIPNVNEARTFMMNQGKNVGCHKAYAPNGDTLHSTPTFRYYSSNKEKASILTADLEADIRAADEEVARLAVKIREVSDKKRHANTETQRHETQEKQCERRLNELNREHGQIQFELQELKNREEATPLDVGTLEEEVLGLESRLAESTARSQSLQAELDNAASHHRDAEANHEDISTQITQVTTQFDSIKLELITLEQKLESAKNAKKHYEGKMKDHEKEIATLKKSYDAVDKKLQEDIKKAEEICEKVITRRKAGSIENEIQQISKRIQAEEKNRGSEEEITRKYHETLQGMKNIKSEVTKLDRFLRALDVVMTNRNLQYTEFRRMIALRAKYFFIIMLSNRSYTGKITFDHVKESLTMSVQPNAAGVKQSADLKSLSGGERSFSTVCFILALWDTMDSPFRCLDEFDVFMDMVNRRISMDMMMDVALKHKGHQFVFLTPQDMSFLKSKVGVNIFRMPNPQRGQGVLPFVPANQDDNDDDENPGA